MCVNVAHDEMHLIYFQCLSMERGVPLRIQCKTHFHRDHIAFLVRGEDHDGTK